MKLYRKIKHNENVCRAHDLGSYPQGQGCNQVRGRAGYRSVFFDTIFILIQIDQYSIYHLIHALKTVIYEIFVKSSQ